MEEKRPDISEKKLESILRDINGNRKERIGDENISEDDDDGSASDERRFGGKRGNPYENQESDSRAKKLMRYESEDDDSDSTQKENFERQKLANSNSGDSSSDFVEKMLPSARYITDWGPILQEINK